jgi:hypothetical protein
VTARRTTRLVLAPLVVAVAAGLVAGWGTRGAVVAVPLVLYWLIAASAEAVTVLMLTPTRLVRRGQLGGPVTLTTQGVSCDYVPVRIRERSLQLALLEIRDTSGHTITVPRWGWGHRSHALFTALGSWLDAADAQVSPQAAQRLRAWAGGPPDRARPSSSPADERSE